MAACWSERRSSSYMKSEKFSPSPLKLPGKFSILSLDLSTYLNSLKYALVYIISKETNYFKRLYVCLLTVASSGTFFLVSYWFRRINCLYFIAFWRFQPKLYEIMVVITFSKRMNNNKQKINRRYERWFSDKLDEGNLLRHKDIENRRYRLPSKCIDEKIH